MRRLWIVSPSLTNSVLGLSSTAVALSAATMPVLRKRSRIEARMASDSVHTCNNWSSGNKDEEPSYPDTRKTSDLCHGDGSWRTRPAALLLLLLGLVCSEPRSLVDGYVLTTRPRGTAVKQRRQWLFGGTSPRPFGFTHEKSPASAAVCEIRRPTYLFDSESTTTAAASPSVDLSQFAKATPDSPNTMNGNSETPQPATMLNDGSVSVQNMTVSNGVDVGSSSLQVNGNSVPKESFPFFDESSLSEDDVPRPTENGGYTHTKTSRAKISAANKGRTPWNKGKQRSEAVRARIAEGVRRRNRQRFLEKLQAMGVTEEEYEAQKREERRKKEAERRARRTEKGGYRPTEETKQKISKILKEKYASGEVKPRTIDPSKVRRGFTHSEETKAKIAASLRKRWATDSEYRDNMLKKSTSTDEEIRKKISASLRKKWQDPEFRNEMLSKFSSRRKPSGGSGHDLSHREKISAAMKAKWQDEEYRKKTMESIAKRKSTMTSKRRQSSISSASASSTTSTPRRKVAQDSQQSSQQNRKPPSRKLIRSAKGAGGDKDDNDNVVIRAVQPRKKPQQAASAVNREKRATTATSKTTSTEKPSPAPSKNGVSKPSSTEAELSGPKKILNGVNGTSKASKEKENNTLDSEESDQVKETLTKRKSKKKKAGNVELLKEERRDLYDLLYGDDDEETQRANGPLASVFLGDENLDSFDPYGLEEN